jgi:hypothetical protein
MFSDINLIYLIASTYKNIRIFALQMLRTINPISEFTSIVVIAILDCTSLATDYDEIIEGLETLSFYADNYSNIMLDVIIWMETTELLRQNKLMKLLDKDNILSNYFAYQNLPSRQLFIRNIAFRTTEETLYNVFSCYGPVEAVRIEYEKYSKRSRGYGFITFYNSEDANKALLLNKKLIDGREIECFLATAGQNSRPINKIYLRS